VAATLALNAIESAWAVSVSAVRYCEHSDSQRSIVNSVDDPVGTASC
jgi:hypothetical protein